MTVADETTIEADIEELESELVDSDIPELTSEADEIQGTIDDLEERMDDLDGELNQLQLEKQYAESSIADLNDKLSRGNVAGGWRAFEEGWPRGASCDRVWLSGVSPVRLSCRSRYMTGRVIFIRIPLGYP